MLRVAPLALLALTACAHQAPAPPAHIAPPGVAYAWATFDARSMTDRGTFGLADRAAGRQLTIDDPVRIASISKLVVALGVMRLVEAGTLNLDEDVSEKLGYRLRNPAYPDVPITLRQLLSHRSSLQDEVDYVVPLGRSLRDVLADPKAFDSAHAPGSFFRYSNLGFPVIASVMERATGERFDLLMRRLVTTALGIDACFGWAACSDRAVARAVVLYELDGTVVRDDLKGRQPDCPVVTLPNAPCDLASYRLGENGAIFSPQGGLRISARDLATIGRLILNEGRHKGRTFLRKESLDTMLQPVWRATTVAGATDSGFYCAYGLGVQSLPVDDPQCDDDLFGDGRRVVGHAGEAYRLRSGLWVDRNRGVGVAYFATNNGTTPPAGLSQYRAIEESLARNLGN